MVGMFQCPRTPVIIFPLFPNSSAQIKLDPVEAGSDNILMVYSISIKHILHSETYGGVDIGTAFWFAYTFRNRAKRASVIAYV
jgi:hypothetical protein